jgi:hypothetical protein
MVLPSRLVGMHLAKEINLSLLIASMFMIFYFMSSLIKQAPVSLEVSP